LFYGGGPSVLEAQMIGSLTICAATLGVSLIMMYLIKALPHPWSLRVEAEGEKMGLDIFEHGSEAYPAQGELLAEVGRKESSVSV
jgi:ammonia channel protein AmtB